MRMKVYANIAEYIKMSPKSVQGVLYEMRKLIRELAPGTEEAIRYGMPTIRCKGKNLLHFAAYGDHIGFYPTPSGINAFREDLKPFVTGKGTISFPIDGPIPWGLIKKIVKFRIKEYSG